MIGSRVNDPYNSVPGWLVKSCQDKIEDALLVLSSSSDNNGNPLLFAHASGKAHILNDSDPERFRTAATDGSKFFWYPKFLHECSGLKAVVILKHEAYHNLLFHPEQMREVDYPKLFNIAADFIVNSMIQREWRSSTYNVQIPDPENHPLWSYPLGKPITLVELKEVFEADRAKLKEAFSKRIEDVRKKHNKNSDKQQCNHQCEAQSKAEPKVEDSSSVSVKYTLVDESLLGKSAMEIYKELKDWYQRLDDDMRELLHGFMTDEHMESNREYADAVEELLRCVGLAKQMRGTIPDEIESQLNELADPTLDLREFTEQAIQKTKRDGGNRASYTRFKRRFIGQEFFYPKYTSPRSQILVLLDVSGSMSDNDIAVGVSELKQFIGLADIYIVPVDAKPHWEHISKVTKMSDFKSVKIVGRGGTVFESFFKDYRFKLQKYGHFNSIIVITDGMIDIIPKEYTPQCDVGWVITSPEKFIQHFGKPIYLTRK